MTKKNFEKLAREHILKYTGKKTVLDALMHFHYIINGPVEFVNMVEQAMAQAYSDGQKSVKKAEKEKPSE